MNLKRLAKALPVRIAFSLCLLLAWWLAIKYWPAAEEPAKTAAPCIGLQCSHADDTAKALQAQDQLPAPANK